MSNEINIIKEDEFNKTSMMKDFLIELMLTKQWFSYSNVLIDDDLTSEHISAYAHRLGLVKYANEGDYKYEISVKGKKYLEKQKGENNEQ